MAASFNLTAQLNLVGPSNIRPIVRNIRNQLGDIKAEVSVSISEKSIANTTKLNSALRKLNRTLSRTRDLGKEAATSLNLIGQSIQNIKSAGRIASDVENVAKATQKLSSRSKDAAKDLSVARTELEEFGRQSGLAVRRFAAFSLVTSIIGRLNTAISSAVDEFVSFDKELVRVAQVTNKNINQLSGLTSTITRLSTEFGVSSKELLQVSSTLAQAGLTANQTEAALKALALSAKAPSFDDLSSTVEGSIAIMRQFGIASSDLEKALGSINAVAAAFAVEASDLVTAIQRTGGVFASASRGVSSGTDALNEFLAVFTSIRATTRESAETIATGLRTIFARIQRKDTIESLRAFGIELTDLEGKFVGPYEAIRRLSEGLSGLDPRSLEVSKIVEELGGFRQIGKVIPLIQQFKTAQEALAVAQQGSGSLARDAATAQLSLATKITQVREEFIALIRDIGNNSVFKGFLDITLSISKALLGLARSAKGIFPLLTILTAAKGVSAITQFVGGFREGFSKTKQDKSTSSRIGKNISETLVGAKNEKNSRDLQNNNQELGKLSSKINKVESSISNLSSIFNNLSSNLEKNISALSDNTTKISSLTSAISELTLKINNSNPKNLRDGGKILGFNRGGVVPGSGKGDKVPAMLEPGEVVMSNRAVNKYGRGNLVRMNEYSKGRKVVDASPTLQKAHIGADIFLSKKQIQDYANNYKNKKFITAVNQAGYTIDEVKTGKFNYETLKSNMQLKVKEKILLKLPTTYNQALKTNDPDLVSQKKLIEYLNNTPNIFSISPVQQRKNKQQISQARVDLSKMVGRLPARMYKDSDQPNTLAFDHDSELDTLAPILKQYFESSGVDLMFRAPLQTAVYRKKNEEGERVGRPQIRRQDRASAKWDKIGKNTGGKIQKFLDGGWVERMKKQNTKTLEQEYELLESMLILFDAGERKAPANTFNADGPRMEDIGKRETTQRLDAIYDYLQQKKSKARKSFANRRGPGLQSTDQYDETEMLDAILLYQAGSGPFTRALASDKKKFKDRGVTYQTDDIRDRLLSASQFSIPKKTYSGLGKSQLKEILRDTGITPKTLVSKPSETLQSLVGQTIDFSTFLSVSAAKSQAEGFVQNPGALLSIDGSSASQKTIDVVKAKAKAGMSSDKTKSSRRLPGLDKIKSSKVEFYDQEKEFIIPPNTSFQITKASGKVGDNLSRALKTKSQAEDSLYDLYFDEDDEDFEKTRLNLQAKMLNRGGLVQKFMAGGVAQRKVGYIDYDVIANEANASIVEAGMKKSGVKGPRLYTDYLTDLAIKKRKENSLSKLRAIYGVAGSGKTTLARGQGTDDATLRQTTRFPVLTPEDIDKANEVILLSSTVSKEKLDEMFSEVDRAYTLSSTTKEEKDRVRSQRESRDATGIGLEGRKPGTTSSVARDTAIGEALLGDRLGDKSVVLGRTSSGRLRQKKGNELVEIIKKRIGVTWGGFAPMTLGHESIMDSAKAMGISPEDFLYLVGSNEGIDLASKDESKYRTAIFNQDSRVLLAKAGAGARGATVLPKAADFEVPIGFDISEAGSDRRKVLLPDVGSTVFAADKTPDKLEKYIDAGYKVKNLERSGGISGTLVRDLIAKGDLSGLQKVLSPGVYELISNNIGRIQNRANILPSLIQQVRESQAVKLADVEKQIKAVGISRVEKKKMDDPEYAAKAETLLELRALRDKIKSSGSFEPYRLLDRLAADQPDKYGLDFSMPDSTELKPIRTIGGVEKASIGGLIKKFEQGGAVRKYAKAGKVEFGSGQEKFPRRISNAYFREMTKLEDNKRFERAWETYPKDERLLVDDSKVLEMAQQPFNREDFISSFKDKISRNLVFQRMGQFAQFVGLPPEDFLSAIPTQLDFGAPGTASAVFSADPSGPSTRGLEGVDLTQYGFAEADRQDLFAYSKLIEEKQKEILKTIKTPVTKYDDGSFSYDYELAEKLREELSALQLKQRSLKDKNNAAIKSAKEARLAEAQKSGRGGVSFMRDIFDSSRRSKNDILYHELTHQLINSLRTKNAESFEVYKARVSGLFEGDNDDVALAYDALIESKRSGYNSADVAYGRSYKIDGLGGLMMRSSDESFKKYVNSDPEYTPELRKGWAEARSTVTAKEFKPINPKINDILLRGGISQDVINKYEDNGKEEFLTTLMQNLPVLDETLSGVLDSTLTELLSGAGITRQQYNVGGLVQRFMAGSVGGRGVQRTTQATAKATDPTRDLIVMAGIEDAMRIAEEKGILAGKEPKRGELPRDMLVRLTRGTTGVDYKTALAEFINSGLLTQTGQLTAQGLAFGAVGVEGTPYTNETRKVTDPKLKNPVDILINGRLAKSEILARMQANFEQGMNQGSLGAAQDVIISQILDDVIGGDKLISDFDKVINQGADNIFSDPKVPFGEFSDPVKVEEALKKSTLTRFGESLVDLVNSVGGGGANVGELLSRMYINTARPQSTAGFIKNWLDSVGLPIPEGNIYGVGGLNVSGSDIPRLKAEIVERIGGGTFVDDDIRNVESVGALTSVPVKSKLFPVNFRSAPEDNSAKGIMFQNMLELAGAKRARGSIDFPDGLGIASDIIQDGDIFKSIPTDAKYTLLGPNDLLDNIVNYLSSRGYNNGGLIQKLFWGGKLNPLAKKYGLTQKEFDREKEIAKAMGLGVEDFEKRLEILASRKQRGKDLKFGILDTQADLMASNTIRAQEEAALQEFLSQKYNGGLVSKIETFADGGMAGGDKAKNKNIIRSFSGNNLIATFGEGSSSSGEVVAAPFDGGLFAVTSSQTSGGGGRSLYDAVMEMASSKGKKLMSDRSRVSNSALAKIWTNYFVKGVGQDGKPVSKSPLPPEKMYTGSFFKDTDYPEPNPSTWTGPAVPLQYAYSKFATGGSVPALVSNGEAYVPPKLAKRIGYGTLNKMNQADRNGMGRFSSGGISIFKGPGSGTSDSIPTSLPVGSFIIREKATKALGLNKGGFVQRFVEGGPAKSDTDKLVAQLRERIAQLWDAAGRKMGVSTMKTLGAPDIQSVGGVEMTQRARRAMYTARPVQSSQELVERIERESGQMRPSTKETFLGFSEEQAQRADRYEAGGFGADYRQSSGVVDAYESGRISGIPSAVGPEGGATKQISSALDKARTELQEIVKLEEQIAGIRSSSAEQTITAEQQLIDMRTSSAAEAVSVTPMSDARRENRKNDQLPSIPGIAEWAAGNDEPPPTPDEFPTPVVRAKPPATPPPIPPAAPPSTPPPPPPDDRPPWGGGPPRISRSVTQGISGVDLDFLTASAQDAKMSIIEFSSALLQARDVAIQSAIEQGKGAKEAGLAGEQAAMAFSGVSAVAALGDNPEDALRSLLASSSRVQTNIQQRKDELSDPDVIAAIQETKSLIANLSETDKSNYSSLRFYSSSQRKTDPQLSGMMTPELKRVFESRKNIVSVIKQKRSETQARDFVAPTIDAPTNLIEVEGVNTALDKVKTEAELYASSLRDQANNIRKQKESAVDPITAAALEGKAQGLEEKATAAEDAYKALAASTQESVSWFDTEYRAAIDTMIIRSESMAKATQDVEKAMVDRAKEIASQQPQLTTEEIAQQVSTEARKGEGPVANAQTKAKEATEKFNIAQSRVDELASPGVGAGILSEKKRSEDEAIAAREAAETKRKQARSRAETFTTRRMYENDEDYEARLEANTEDIIRGPKPKPTISVMSSRKAKYLADQEEAEKQKNKIETEAKQETLEIESDQGSINATNLLTQAVIENTIAHGGNSERLSQLSDSVESNKNALDAASTARLSAIEQNRDEAISSLDANNNEPDSTEDVIEEIGILDFLENTVDSINDAVDGMIKPIEESGESLSTFQQKIASGGRFLAKTVQSIAKDIEETETSFANSSLGSALSSLESVVGLIGTAAVAGGIEQGGEYLGGDATTAGRFTKYAVGGAFSGAATAYGAARSAGAGKGAATAAAISAGVTGFIQGLGEAERAAREYAKKLAERDIEEFGEKAKGDLAAYEQTASAVDLKSTLENLAQLADAEQRARSGFEGDEATDASGNLTDDFISFSREAARQQAQASEVAVGVLQKAIREGGGGAEGLDAILGGKIEGLDTDQVNTLFLEIAQGNSEYQQTLAQLNLTSDEEIEKRKKLQNQLEENSIQAVAEALAREQITDAINKETAAREALATQGFDYFKDLGLQTTDQQKQTKQALNIANILGSGGTYTIDQSQAASEAYATASGTEVEKQKAAEAAYLQELSAADVESSKLESLLLSINPEDKELQKQINLDKANRLEGIYKSRGMDTTNPLFQKVLEALRTDPAASIAEKQLSVQEQTRKIAEEIKQNGIPISIDQATGEAKQAVGANEQKSTIENITNSTAFSLGSNALNTALATGAGNVIYNRFRRRQPPEIETDSSARSRAATEAEATDSSTRSRATGEAEATPRPRPEEGSASKSKKSRSPSAPEVDVSPGKSRFGGSASGGKKVVQNVLALLGLGVAAYGGSRLISGGGGEDEALSELPPDDEIIALLAAIENNTRACCMGGGMGMPGATGEAGVVGPSGQPNAQQAKEKTVAEALAYEFGTSAGLMDVAPSVLADAIGVQSAVSTIRNKTPGIPDTTAPTKRAKVMSGVNVGMQAVGATMSFNAMRKQLNEGNYGYAVNEGLGTLAGGLNAAGGVTGGRTGLALGAAGDTASFFRNTGRLLSLQSLNEGTIGQDIISAGSDAVQVGAQASVLAPQATAKIVEKATGQAVVQSVGQTVNQLGARALGLGVNAGRTTALVGGAKAAGGLAAGTVLSAGFNAYEAISDPAAYDAKMRKAADPNNRTSERFIGAINQVFGTEFDVAQGKMGEVTDRIVGGLEGFVDPIGKIVEAGYVAAGAMEDLSVKAEAMAKTERMTQDQEQNRLVKDEKTGEYTKVAKSEEDFDYGLDAGVSSVIKTNVALEAQLNSLKKQKESGITEGFSLDSGFAENLSDISNIDEAIAELETWFAASTSDLQSIAKKKAQEARAKEENTTWWASDRTAEKRTQENLALYESRRQMLAETYKPTTTTSNTEEQILADKEKKKAEEEQLLAKTKEIDQRIQSVFENISIPETDKKAISQRIRSMPEEERNTLLSDMEAEVAALSQNNVSAGGGAFSVADEPVSQNESSISTNIETNIVKIADILGKILSVISKEPLKLSQKDYSKDTIEGKYSDYSLAKGMGIESRFANDIDVIEKQKEITATNAYLNTEGTEEDKLKAARDSISAIIEPDNTSKNTNVVGILEKILRQLEMCCGMGAQQTQNQISTNMLSTKNNAEIQTQISKEDIARKLISEDLTYGLTPAQQMQAQSQIGIEDRLSTTTDPEEKIELEKRLQKIKDDLKTNNASAKDVELYKSAFRKTERGQNVLQQAQVSSAIPDASAVLQQYGGTVSNIGGIDTSNAIARLGMGIETGQIQPQSIQAPTHITTQLCEILAQNAVLSQSSAPTPPTTMVGGTQTITSQANEGWSLPNPMDYATPVLLSNAVSNFFRNPSPEQQQTENTGGVLSSITNTATRGASSVLNTVGTAANLAGFDVTKIGESLQGVFGSFVDSLKNITFPKIPDKIMMEGKHTVEVIINGAEVLKSLDPMIREVIDTKILEFKNKINKDTEGGFGP